MSKGISEQLRYIALAEQRLRELLAMNPEAEEELPSWLRKRLEIIPVVHQQQKEMFESNTRSCENRIVSLEQPHVRPVVRGKRPDPTEFGQKLICPW